MKQLLIYDLDGTLVDTAEDITQAANHLRATRGLAPLPRDQVSRFVGKGLHQLVSNCLETEDPKQIEKGAKIYREHYAAHMLDHSRLYPGVREFLEYFKSRIQAVITNKPDPFSRKILEALGVADYFVTIVAGDSEYPKKPDPKAVLAVMKKQGVTKDQTLFIGDSPVDIETSRNAGIETAVIRHGFSSEDELKSAHPDAIAEDFRELLKIAQKRGW